MRVLDLGVPLGRRDARVAEHVLDYVQDRPAPEQVDGGGEYKVTVTIADVGPDYPPRYRVHAVDEYGRTASGAAHNSLQMALSLVRWRDLDTPRQVECGR